MSKLSKTGLKCPACGGHTVNRDVSPDDGYFVEYCTGGKIILILEDGTKEQVACEYWGTGWAK